MRGYEGEGCFMNKDKAVSQTNVKQMQWIKYTHMIKTFS